MKPNGRIAVGLASAAMLMIFSTAAWSQKMQTSTNSSGDTSFVTKAAEGGLAEVQLGNLVEQKTSNAAVKQFAQRMVTDHTKINDQLKEVASKDNLALPTTLSAKDQALKNRLERLSGHAFNKAYMEAMVKDHHADISEFQHEASHGSNPDLKTFASNTVPTLESHLKQAENTLSEVNTGRQGTAARQQ
jgi:putative membrane protein